MKDLADRYGDFASVFIYVREAHPGELHSHHDSMARKLTHARSFRERWSVRRPILVDDLTGTLHRAHGTAPNMAYIVDARGRLAYRAMWTDGYSIARALDYLRHEAAERQTTHRVAPFYAEILGHRTAADFPGVFVDGLARGGGRRAVEEFIAATERREGGAAANRLRRVWSEMQGQSERPQA